MNRKSSYIKKVNGIAAIAMVIICAWGIAGHLLWDVTKQACYQYIHHVKNERSFRDTLVLHRSVFHNPHTVERIKKDEIRYADRMFDIKREIDKNDSIILVGHYDDFEHHLYKTLQSLFDDDGTQLPGNVKPSWLSWAAVLTLYPGNPLVLFIGPQKYNPQWKNSFHYSLNHPPLHSPPDLFV